MSMSLISWIGAAVLLFWSVGAHNRLVRLRAEIKAAFGAIDAELQPLAQLAETLAGAPAAPTADGEPAAPAPLHPDFLSPLEGAGRQLAAGLAAARARPFDRDRIAALAAACEVWDQAWERAEREDAHDLRGPQMPADVAAWRAQRVQQARQAAARFNESVDRYNQAIGEFPAVLLAWVFGFRQGRGL